ncbi:MAG: DNA polymerase III subunit delta, partial [Deltaproteobacteria bacterium]
MTILELEAELSRGTIAPLYLFYGTERFLMQQALQKLTGRVIDPAVRDFNAQQLLGSEVSASQLVDMAAALPMMSRYRLIVVKDAEPLFQGDVAPLLAYLENPVSTTCLV